ncbi:MAG: type I-U CRISPR-associated protein Csb2 [Propioniciclava sp.]|uniref:type I-G CRISPR-associated protein Csb2 n=1 Tax=Propioniciclava sp. TaxID=2038686 RepID=UPI0039E37EA4
MGFRLSASWPLGSYLAHHPDGSAEAFPTLLRTQAALARAAATGTSASHHGNVSSDFPSMTEASVQALRWLEQNPPCGMILPNYPNLIPSTASQHVIAYRKEGVFDKKVSFSGRVTARDFADATKITAPVSWVWDECPPEEVVQQLDALCADVGWLGEAESIAVLEVHRDVDVNACTHWIQATSFFDDRGTPVDIPIPGRLDALEAQHQDAHPTRHPTAAQDLHRTGDSGLPRSEAPTRIGLATRSLIPVNTLEAEVPWTTVIVLPIVKGPIIGAEDRVRIASDLHRALIATIGHECPAVVTGHYLEGVERPANRVALHYLPPGAPLATGHPDTAHLLVLIPRGVAGTDMDSIISGATRIRYVRTPMGSLTIGAAELLDGHRMWQPQPEGTHREWRTDPVAIPERQGTAGSRTELLALTAAWALGNVMRGLEKEASRRDPKARLAWLHQHGGDVLEADSYFTPRPARFVHRTNRSMPVMPYVARLDLGDLVPPQAVLAIGQSRHLGGGLLVPVDRRRSPEEG